MYYAGFTSSDGVHWAWIPGSTVALNITGFITSGIATDSHNDAAYTIATVDNLAQLGGSTTPPGVCPNGWSCTDIGGALPPGQDTLSNGTWSEVGGGGDIWATADAFHLVSQTLTADGTVSAHVTSQQATNPFAKAGVMLRATTDPGSPYYAAFVTPGQGIAVQWRATQGASTSQILVPGAVPVYLKIARYTTGGQTYYSAYSSPNGTTWTLIAGSTQILAMTGPLLGGFGITSHAQGTGGAVTLDTVAVTPGELPPPGICPAPWSCTDVGGALPAGQDTLTNGTWSEVARWRGHLGHGRHLPPRDPGPHRGRDRLRPCHLATDDEPVGQGRGHAPGHHRPGVALLRGLRHARGRGSPCSGVPPREPPHRTS